MIELLGRKIFGNIICSSSRPNQRIAGPYTGFFQDTVHVITERFTIPVRFGGHKICIKWLPSPNTELNTDITRILLHIVIQYFYLFLFIGDPICQLMHFYFNILRQVVTASFEGIGKPSKLFPILHIALVLADLEIGGSKNDNCCYVV